MNPNFNYSFKLGRLFEVDIWIHWTLPAVILFYVMRAGQHHVPTAFILLFVLIPYLLLFGSVVAHEFGHVFAARYFGMHVDYILLTPIGGAVLTGSARTAWAEFVVAICGPLMNILLILLALSIYIPLGGPVGLELFIPFQEGSGFVWLFMTRQWFLLILYTFIETQCFLFLFNMLMLAYPMDGGRVLRAILWHFKGVARGTIISCKVAKVFAILMAIVGLVTFNIMLIIIAVFVYLQADSTLKTYQISHGSWYEKAYTDYSRSDRFSDISRESEKRGGGDEKEAFEKKLDTILDKVHREGMNSLSRKERNFLKEASKKYKEDQD